MKLIQFVFLAVLCLSGARVHADGMMVASKGDPGMHSNLPAIEKPVTIPSQRAVIKWEDGVQTMLVESVVSGPRGVYGWVVPLPNEPLFVKAVNPSYMLGSFGAVQPEIKNEHSTPAHRFLPFIVFAAVVLLTSGYRRRAEELGTRVTGFMLELGGLVLVGAILFPIFAEARVTAGGGYEGRADEAFSKAPASEVEVRSLGTIGSYDVDVVSAKTAEPLLEWMRERNFQVPNRALPAIDSYVKEGWVFLAAKLRKDRDEPWPAHPLKAVFTSEKPIYPMRLTGTQDEPLRLELLVIGRERAAIDEMEVWQCQDRGITIPIASRSDLEKEVYSDWKNGLYAMAKYGMAVTYFRADLKPEQMKEDFQIRWTPFEAYEAEVWATKAAQARFELIAVQWLPIGIVLFGLVGVWWPKRVALWALGGPLASIALAGGLAMAWRSQIKEVETLEQPRWMGHQIPPYDGH